VSNENKKDIVPYIGITGFMNRGEVATMLGLMPEMSGRKLMVGVLVNWETLQGKKLIKGNRHPKVEDISNIFVSSSLALNMIHYHTGKTETLFEQMAGLVELAGPNLNGFQLNITWPPIEELRKFRSEFPDFQIILAITKKAFDSVNNSPECLVMKIKEYDGLFDYVLLDSSGGKGLPMDIKKMQEYLLAMEVFDKKIGIVVAGGLGPKTMNLASSLMSKNRNLSIDAEGNIRNQDDDSLNLNWAGDYLAQGLKMAE